MNINNVSNEYVRELGRLYDKTPKAVFAAIAYSLAMRLNGDRPHEAAVEVINEWEALHANGIVPQKPPTGDDKRS